MIRGSALAAPTPPRETRLLLAGLRVRPLALFRVVAGGALAGHFLRCASHTADWLGGGGGFIYPAVEGTIHWRASILVASLSVVALRAIFLIGALGSLAVAAGVATRAIAVGLYFLCVSIHWAVLPVGNADDVAATVTTLFLLILPNATTADLTRSGGTNAPARTGVVEMLLVCVSLLYLSGLIEGAVAGVGGLPVPVSVLLKVIPVAYFLPGSFLRGTAVVLQLAVHAYLLATTGLVMLNLGLAASAFLFWSQGNSSSARAFRADWGTVVGLAVGALFALIFGGLAFGRPLLAPAQLLSDLAVLPPAWVFSAPILPPLSVRIGPDVSASRVVPYAESGLRDRIAISRSGHLEANDPLLGLIRSALVRRQCMRAESRSQRVELLWGDGREGSVRFADFACGAHGEPLR